MNQCVLQLPEEARPEKSVRKVYKFLAINSRIARQPQSVSFKEWNYLPEATQTALLAKLKATLEGELGGYFRRMADDCDALSFTDHLLAQHQMLKVSQSAPQNYRESAAIRVALCNSSSQNSFALLILLSKVLCGIAAH